MEWAVRGDEVWILVDRGEQLDIEQVVREADAAGYEGLDVEEVRRAVAGGESRAIARVGAGSAGAVSVAVSDDAMTATLHVTAPGPAAAPFTRADVDAALDAAGVRLGVDHLLLASLPLHVSGSYLVASGWAAVPGPDGRVEYALSASSEFRPRARDDGGVDFRAVATIPGVSAGQLLAVLVDPSPGTPGRTVRGDVLPAEPGRPAVLPIGENVVESDDGQRLYAAIDGLLELQGARVSVRPDLVIPGDVDFTTGSVAFAGDVVVRGSVRPGFRVEATGRVVVLGDVEQAEVRAGSLVWVKGAVVGQRSVVRSGGDVKVRTVHEARVEARGSVYVERELADTTVLASVDLVLEAPRNRISGGTAWVGHQVTAGEIGAAGEVATRVIVGVDPFTAELRESLSAERAEHARALERVGDALRPFHADPGLLRRVSQERRRAAERLGAVERSLRARLGEVEARMAELEPRQDGSEPCVVARRALRPGVVLEMGQARLRLRRTEHQVVATESRGRIAFSPLSRAVAPRFSVAVPTRGDEHGTHNSAERGHVPSPAVR